MQNKVLVKIREKAIPHVDAVYALCALFWSVAAAYGMDGFKTYLFWLCAVWFIVCFLRLQYRRLFGPDQAESNLQRLEWASFARWRREHTWATFATAWLLLCAGMLVTGDWVVGSVVLVMIAFWHSRRIQRENINHKQPESPR